MEFMGEFETHLTIAYPEPASASQFALTIWARDHGMKFLQIELADGLTPVQPMLSWRGNGSRTSQMVRIQRISDELAKAGFCVTRSKLEASPSNDDIPENDTDVDRDANRYFEHHVKLLLSHDDTLRVQQIAQRHEAHLSRNAFVQRVDSLFERFVTQRCWNVGRKTAQRRLDILLSELQRAALTIIESEAEYVVYDSNLSLDAGWITEGGTDA